MHCLNYCSSQGQSTSQCCYYVVMKVSNTLHLLCDVVQHCDVICHNNDVPGSASSLNRSLTVHYTGTGLVGLHHPYEFITDTMSLSKPRPKWKSEYDAHVRKYNTTWENEYPCSGGSGGGGVRQLRGFTPPPEFFLFLFCLSVYETSRVPGP